MTRMKRCVGGLFGLGLLLAGCNGGGDGAAAVPESELVGKWFFKSAVSKGFTRAVDSTGREVFRYDIDEDTTYPAKLHFIDFKADKSYLADRPELGGSDINAKRSAQPAGLESGVWSVSGNTLTTASSDLDTTRFSIAVNGSDATFSTVDKGKIVDPTTRTTFENDIAIKAVLSR